MKFSEHVLRLGPRLLLIAAGIALNLTGSFLIRKLELPLYLDSIGTVIAAVLGGYIPGIVTGYFSSALNMFSSTQHLYYGFIGPLIAITSAWMANAGFFRSFRKSLWLIPALALVGGGLGTLLTWFLSGVATDAESTISYASYVMPLRLSPFWSQFVVDLTLDVIDKTVTILSVTLLLQWLPIKFLRELGTEQRLRGNVREHGTHRQQYRTQSLHTKIALIVAGATLAGGLLCVGVGYILFRNANYESQLQKVRGLAAIAALHIPGDLAEHWSENEKSAETMRKVEPHFTRLREAFRGVQFVYLCPLGNTGKCSPWGRRKTVSATRNRIVPSFLLPMDSGPEKQRFQRGKPFPPTLSYRENGPVLTAGHPIFNSAGKCVAYVFVDMAMKQVMAGWTAYVVKMCSALLGLLILIGALVVGYVERTTVRPLNAVSAAAGDFVFEGNRPTLNRRTKMAALQIHTGDEIEYLYQSLLKTTGEIEDALRDLENSRKKETEIRKFLQLILDNLPGCVLAKDPNDDFRYVIWNKQLEAHTGWRADRVIGKNDFEIAPYPGCAEAFRQSDLKVLETGQLLELDEECVSATGACYHYHTRKVLIRTPMREMIVDLCYDMTELRKLQRKLLRAMENANSANKAKSAFLATMSHEIRTPLNAIIGFSELLQHTDLSRAEQLEYLESINLAGNSLLSLINDILDLSKIESDQMKLERRPVNLNTLAEEMRAIFLSKAREQGIELRTQLAPDLPIVEIDALRMRQILLNLLGNAVKYTHAGFVELGIAFTRQKDGRGELEIRVSDTGIGIPAAAQKKIFQPFTQVDNERDTVAYKGTGLGLAIVSRLLEKMGGTVRLESEVDRGSTFRIVLRGIAYHDTPEIAPETVGPGDRAEVSLEGKIVLIVDDVHMNLQVLTALLKRLGCKVITAASGPDALEALRSCPAQAVLTDMWMPGMNGTELAAKIRRQYPHLPVIALTADTEILTRDSAVFDSILLKPLTIRALRDVLEKFISVEASPVQS